METGREQGAKDPNATLRNEPSAKAAPAEVHAIRAALDANRIVEDVVVFRGVADPHGGHILKKAEVAFRKGLPISVLGFLSTTIDPEGTMVKDQGTVVLRIFVPKGARALYVAPLSAYPEEMEMLLDHGTKFRVLGFENAQEKHFIDLAAIP